MQKWNVRCTYAQSETEYKIGNVEYLEADAKSEFANVVYIAHQYCTNIKFNIRLNN